MLSHNNSKRRKQLNQVQAIDDELCHQIAVVERELEVCPSEQREHYRALLRRLQQVLAMEADTP